MRVVRTPPGECQNATLQRFSKKKLHVVENILVLRLPSSVPDSPLDLDRTSMFKIDYIGEGNLSIRFNFFGLDMNFQINKV